MKQEATQNIETEKQRIFTIQNDGSLREDFDAISVFDYLHTDENQASYRQNNIEFADIADRVLRKQTFNIAIKRVLTANDNTSLRLKNINHEMSPTFRNFTGNSRPVVLGNPLFGNLFSMEKLGNKIAIDKKYDGEYVRDTWLIEIFGGPNTDCPTCPNYDMDDLTDNYFPALIGGVLAYTGESEVDYVGYSAGAGVGARSYEKHSSGIMNDIGYFVNDNGDWEQFDLPANSIKHMALIGPMLAFNGTTPFTRCIDEYGNGMLDELEGMTHFDKGAIGKATLATLGKDTQGILTRSIFIIGLGDVPLYMLCRLEGVIGSVSETNDISYNFWQDIVKSVQNKTDANPVLDVDNLMMIRGDTAFGVNDDLVIPDKDIENTYDNAVTSVARYRANINVIGHGGMQNDKATYNPLLSKFLNDKSFGIIERLYYIDEYEF